MTFKILANLAAFAVHCQPNWNVLIILTSRELRVNGYLTERILPVPQEILDRLTDIAMPKLVNERPLEEVIDVLGLRLPVRRCGTLVLGSGAAGLRAAVELKRRNVDVGVAAQSAYGGTSACSGSDKQTLHT